MGRRTSFRRGATFVVAVALAVAFCAVIYEGQIYRTVKALPVGTPEAQVLRRLGPPHDSGTKFYLAQEKSYEARYRAAAESSSVRYLFWRGGVLDDVVCAVGFDRDGRVSYTACGGT